MPEPLARPPAHPRRLVFLGTPDMAVPPLRALHAAGYEIPLVVSRADKRRGRGTTLTPSPVKAAATELGIPVTSTVDDALEVGAELGVVVAFGRIIRRPVLERLAMVNLHFSLLPRWRGAAPVERAVLAGDERTGVDVMDVAEGLDEGDVHAEAVLAIGPDETADELRVRLVGAGTELLLATLGKGLGEGRPQVGEPVYAHKIDPADLALDWSRPAAELHRVVRVGGAWTTFRGRRLKVWRTRPGGAADAGPPGPPGEPGQLVDDGVVTGDGVLHLVEVQPEGRGRQPVAAWRNGARPAAGERLGP
jgi:methionyl-tRNA formyltransferase